MSETERGELEYLDEVKARPLTHEKMFKPHTDFISPFFYDPRWATSSTDSRTYDEVPNEDMQVIRLTHHLQAQSDLICNASL